ncbi:hypothetical protein ARMGADRAFT_1048367 [Armillaria gallica]|uniref:Uncharacterized protein n=1 Tax=Armillaria gallica TaxID=47427 RepID=A0A2H3CZA5_ARMGA|nr:hypothetical protein ARMGADRAFT_1048367 [Armillaria gallica]
MYWVLEQIILEHLGKPFPITICNAHSPQEICSRLMDASSTFCQELLAYLEGAHESDYFDKSQKEVLSDLVIPEPPPCPCTKLNCFIPECSACKNISSWWTFFKQTVNFVVAMTHIHSCGDNTNTDSSKKKNKYDSKGCLVNKWGKCKARFSCKIVKEHKVNKEGHLMMQKLKVWINTFMPLPTYLFHCNTDVTSLQSRTAINTVISYVSDYVTKPALKTHVIFKAI